MFGMGGTEILVILIVALLFLGPDKLPEAAKSISKGIRDLRKQTREFQETIEADERIGGAIRDLKSALNGEDPKPRPRPAKLPRPVEETVAGTAAAVTAAAAAGVEAAPAPQESAPGTSDDAPAVAVQADSAPAAEPATPRVTLPPTAGEPSEGSDRGDDTSDLAALIKPAEGSVAKSNSHG